MIVLDDGNMHETSRVANPDLASEGAEHYHRACFSELHGEHDART
jgi:hypothetical protein